MKGIFVKTAVLRYNPLHNQQMFLIYGIMALPCLPLQLIPVAVTGCILPMCVALQGIPFRCLHTLNRQPTSTKTQRFVTVLPERFLPPPVMPAMYGTTGREGKPI